MKSKWIALSEPRTYRKESLPVWTGVDDDGDPLNIDAEYLEHLDGKVKEFREAKIKIPILATNDHSEDPRNTLGEVVASEVKLNDDGLPSLYLDVQFQDAEAEKIGLRNDVSIFSPPEMRDGKGTIHEFPLKHLAACNTPRIAGLEPYKAIAASLRTVTITREEKETMSKAINMALGLGEDAKESDALAAIGKLLKSPEPEPKAEPAEVPVSPGLMSTIRDARKTTLMSLVTDFHITAERHDELTKEWMTDKAIAMTVQTTKAAVAEQRCFDKVITAHRCKKPIKNSGREAVPDHDGDKGDHGWTEIMKTQAAAAV